MGIEKVNVQITADESEAIASAKRVQREMDKVEAEAKDAQRAVNQARTADSGLRSRFGGLLGRIGVTRGEEDIKFGSAFKFSRQGFGLREDFKKGTGKGGIGALNTALWAGVALHGATNIMEQIAEIRRELRDKTLGEVMREVGRRVPEVVIQTLGGQTGGRFWKAAYTTVTGNDFVTDVDDTFVGRLNYALGQIFGYDNSLDAQIAVQARNRRAFGDKQVQDEMEAKRREAADAALRKIDETVEAQIGKLKTDIVRPKDIRLNREQNRTFQRRHDEAAEKRIRRDAATAKEPHQQVLAGEGR